MQCTDCGDHASCDDGFTGKGCVCDEVWRRPNGTSYCTDCMPNFYGATCDAYVRHHAGLFATPHDGVCAIRRCPNCGAHGVCTDGVSGNGRCVCDPEWFGVLCDNQCPICVHGNCSDGRTGTGRVCSAAPRRWSTPPPALLTTGVAMRCSACASRAGRATSAMSVRSRVPRCCMASPHHDATVYGSGDGAHYGPACATECPSCPFNSVCDAGITGGGCVCAPGFRKLDDGEPCNLCASGYYGVSCVQCPDCHHGRCLDGVNGTGQCVCDSGWYGVNCNMSCPVRATGAPPHHRQAHGTLILCVCTGLRRRVAWSLR